MFLPHNLTAGLGTDDLLAGMPFFLLSIAPSNRHPTRVDVISPDIKEQALPSLASQFFNKEKVELAASPEIDKKEKIAPSWEEMSIYTILNR